MYCATCKKFLIHEEECFNCGRDGHIVLSLMPLKSYMETIGNDDKFKPWVWIPDKGMMEILCFDTDRYCVQVKDFVGDFQLFPDYLIHVEVIR